MKVSLVKDEKQSQTVGAVVYVLKLDEAAKDAEDIIRQGISLKKLIEQAGSNWNAHTGTTELISLGIPVPKEKALGKNYVLMPDAYVELLISPFYEFSSDEKKLISISAELVAGGRWQVLHGAGTPRKIEQMCLSFSQSLIRIPYKEEQPWEPWRTGISPSLWFRQAKGKIGFH